jgi:Cu(I)/Ag(I) efflux system membrane protein CusA/SilA
MAWLGEQRALQDWYIKVCAANRSQVAEVASVRKTYQPRFGPFKMQYYNVSMMRMKAVKTSNNDVGGRKFEMSNMSYIVSLGY